MINTVHTPELSVQSPELQIIRRPQALTMLGISKSNFHNKINAGLLPSAITLGANSKGYFKHEITAVLIAMATDKNQEEVKALVKSLIALRHQLGG
jgi:predicted DNA-binding transcriptional regulator AlpA